MIKQIKTDRTERISLEKEEKNEIKKKAEEYIILKLIELVDLYK